jgi:hypothetical protein
MRLRLSVFACGAALSIASATARASTSYPPLIQQYLGGSTCAPACTVCHRDLNGGTGTVVTPFGRTMMGFGLVAVNSLSLKSALDQDKAAHTDSDGDGDTDIDALMACRDPNQAFGAGDGGSIGEGGASSAGPGFTDPTPEYGCAIRRTPQGDGSTWAAALSALLTLTLLRRRLRATTDQFADAVCKLIG